MMKRGLRSFSAVLKDQSTWDSGPLKDTRTWRPSFRCWNWGSFMSMRWAVRKANSQCRKKTTRWGNIGRGLSADLRVADGALASDAHASVAHLLHLLESGSLGTQNLADKVEAESWYILQKHCIIAGHTSSHFDQKKKKKHYFLHHHEGPLIPGGSFGGNENLMGGANDLALGGRAGGNGVLGHKRKRGDTQEGKNNQEAYSLRAWAGGTRAHHWRSTNLKDQKWKGVFWGKCICFPRFLMYIIPLVLKIPPPPKKKKRRRPMMACLPSASSEAWGRPGQELGRVPWGRGQPWGQAYGRGGCLLPCRFLRCKDTEKHKIEEGGGGEKLGEPDHSTR